MEKSETWFFFRFSTFRIFHVNLNTLKKKNVGGGSTPHQKKCSSIFFKGFKFTWKMRNVLNQKKNQISDFSNFYFFELRSFLWHHHTNFQWIFHDNFKNNIRKNVSIFFILFSTLHIIHKNHIINAKLRGGEGGLHILNWEMAELFYFFEISYQKFALY